MSESNVLYIKRIAGEDLGVGVEGVSDTKTPSEVGTLRHITFPHVRSDKKSITHLLSIGNNMKFK
jgi:hypothetical protein